MAKKWYISEKYLSDKEVSVRPRIVDLTLSPKSDLRFPQLNLAKYIQQLFDDGDVKAGDSFENIVTVTDTGSTGNVIISTSDDNPSVVINNGTVTITTDEKINYIIVQGDDSTNDSSGNLTIVISSKSLSGNTAKENLVVPIVQKTDTSAMAFGDPSPSNPYSLDLDNNPSVKVIGVGTTSNPSISLRIYGLTNTYDKYSITILPL